MAGSTTIVVVDDSADILELLEDVLTDEGFRVIACREATEALETVASEQPALVMVDLVMAGVTQWELVDAMLSDPRTAHTTVIVCSGATHELQAGEARLPADRCAVLVKPFAIDALLGKIELLLGAR
jgi:CheY-like chemotaxis protein